MKRDIQIMEVGMPMTRRGDAGVSVTIGDQFSATSILVSLPEAEELYASVGSAIAALKLGLAYSAGTSPRDVERLYRAKLAVRLGGVARRYSGGFRRVRGRYRAAGGGGRAVMTVAQRIRTFWCESFHLGQIERDPMGHIIWHCRQCGRWSNPVHLADEQAVVDAALACAKVLP